MPEALLAMPPLQISKDNIGETENAGASDEVSGRSSASQESRGLSPLCSSNVGQNRSKVRKSTGKIRQKKLSLKVGSQQKNTAAGLKLKSRIPRPLPLSISSSSTSLTTDSGFQSPHVYSSAVTKEQSITTGLQCQKTGIIYAYHQRKSISQMDIKHFRRNVQFAHLSKDSKALVPAQTCLESQVSFSHNDSSSVHNMYNYGNFGYGTGTSRDPCLAGIKIFAIIMLNAWRKRRDEVKRLTEEVSELKRGVIKAKNQLHVLNSLFRVEQKRNDELNCQLKLSLEDINTAKFACQGLTTSLISLQADKSQLEQKLQLKEREHDNINALVSQTKSELSKSTAMIRELQANLTISQRQQQRLENQKNYLINEKNELCTESKRKEKTLLADIQTKIDEIRNLDDQVYFLTCCREQESKDILDKLHNKRKDIEMLEDEVRKLQKCLDESFANRVKSCWRNCMAIPGITLLMLHWVGFLVLPATPMPKQLMLPFGLTLERALSIVRR